MPEIRGGSTTTPSIPKNVAITANAAVNGQEVRMINTTTGDIIKGKFQGDTLLLNLAESKNGWATSQVMLIKTNGNYYGSTTLTLDGNTGGQAVSLSVTQASTTNTV